MCRVSDWTEKYAMKKNKGGKERVMKKKDKCEEER